MVLFAGAAGPRCANTSPVVTSTVGTIVAIVRLKPDATGINSVRLKPDTTDVLDVSLDVNLMRCAVL
jgi:hypothetical protein